MSEGNITPTFPLRFPKGLSRSIKTCRKVCVNNAIYINGCVCKIDGIWFNAMFWRIILKSAFTFFDVYLFRVRSGFVYWWKLLNIFKIHEMCVISWPVVHLSASQLCCIEYVWIFTGISYKYMDFCKCINLQSNFQSCYFGTYKITWFELWLHVSAKIQYHLLI
jgi:hypothetical protein